MWPAPLATNVLAAGLTTGTATAALAELQPRGDHRAAAVIASESNMTGLGLGPLMAGLFAEYVAMPTHSVFWAYLGLCGLALAVLCAVPETVRNPDRSISLRPRIAVPPAMRTVMCLAGLESELFTGERWLFVAATVAGGIAVGFIFRGGLSELNRLARPRHRAAVVSAFFVAAYLGLGLPVVLVGLISQEVGPVDASAYVSALAAAAVVVAFVVVLRTFGFTAAPTTPCTPSDRWCHPGAPHGLSAGCGARSTPI
jgi:hypothetical protein